MARLVTSAQAGRSRVMQDLSWRQVQAPFGHLWLGALGGQLCQLSWTLPQYALASSPDSADQSLLDLIQEPSFEQGRPRARTGTEAETETEVNPPIFSRLREEFSLQGLSRAEAEANHWLLDRAELQLSQYWAGQRKAFDLPLRLEGTDFQLRVWEELKAIPFGQKRTYAQLAAALGKPAGARAVGTACGKNPLPIFIPCHRVVSSGALFGGHNRSLLGGHNRSLLGGHNRSLLGGHNRSLLGGHNRSLLGGHNRSLLGGYNGGLAIKEFLLSLESPSSTSKGYGKSPIFSDQPGRPQIRGLRKNDSPL